MPLAEQLQLAHLRLSDMLREDIGRLLTAAHIPFDDAATAGELREIAMDGVESGYLALDALTKSPRESENVSVPVPEGSS